MNYIFVHLSGNKMIVTDKQCKHEELTLIYNIHLRQM